MAFEQKDGSGALFKNDRKEKPNQPDYRGDAKIEGVEHWVSAWVKDGKRGKFFSLSFQPKDSQRAPNPNPPKREEDFDDDLPF